MGRYSTINTVKLGGQKVIKPEKIGKFGQLYVGDCIEILKEMPDNSVTGICCDPPKFGIEDEI